MASRPTGEVSGRKLCSLRMAHDWYCSCCLKCEKVRVRGGGICNQAEDFVIHCAHFDGSKLEVVMIDRIYTFKSYTDRCVGGWYRPGGWYGHGGWYGSGGLCGLGG